MATTHSLVLVFRNDAGNEETFTYSDIDDNVAAVQVKTLMQTMITNSAAVLESPLVAMVSATLRTTTTSAYDIS